ncbi:MAG: prepilin-type N-terminal cleavage/methylation domain-containing protein [Sedimentisphaerales bacterium]|nr:prepilin-type N-terminal cleavage/methylation domain-containing protein [Sedimentisphaerales bacterium]
MKRMGFTLIELLVVVSIIALLMAILVPVLGASKQRAKALLCEANIRQLAFSLTMYANDCETFPHALHETFLEPPPGGFPGNPMYDRMGWWWLNYITDYSKKTHDRPSTIVCPSRKIKSGMLKNDALCGNYGVNVSVCKASISLAGRDEFADRPLQISDISRAGETLLIVDSGYSMITWWHAADIPPVSLGSTIEDTAYIPGLGINVDKDLWPGQEPDALDGRHPNKTVNVGFVDGHVSRSAADTLLVRRSGGDTYENRHPLWTPR